MRKITKVLFIITILFFYSPAFADTAVHLDIKTNTNSVYDQDITVAPCDSDSDLNTPDTIAAYCALVQSGITSDWSGLWVNSINEIINNDNDNGVYWMWLANLNTDNTSPSSSYNLSAKQYILNPNDRILFYYNTNPLNISVDNDKPEAGQSIKITVKELGLDSNWNPVWNKASGGKIVIGPDTFDLDNEGTYSFAAQNTNIFKIKGQKDGFINSKELTITPIAAKIVSGGGWWPQEISSPASSTPALIIVAPVVEKRKFDLKKAFEFLIAQQKEDGSFGEDLYTDWSAMALASENYQKQVLKLVKYFGESKMTGILLTDYERRAMALMTLGLNPYNIYPAMDGASGENYIEKIVSGFDGKQFGNINEDNDDIFALIVLQNAGFMISDKMISDDISFILSRQKENGSWDESVDMTGAGIEALSAFSQNVDPLLTSPLAGGGKIQNAITKAREFLKQNQKENGGWGNVSSTAWAIEGILALSEKPEDWKKGENSPLDYIATMQDADGGIKNENMQSKIWETAYVASVLSGKAWNQIMQKFEKPEEIKEQLLKNTPETVVEKTKELKGQSLKNSPRTVLKKAIPATQNTATVINATTETPATTKTEIPKKNWFVRLLENIFGFF